MGKSGIVIGIVLLGMVQHLPAQISANGVFYCQYL